MIATHGTTGALVHPEPEGPARCPRCDCPMRVRKTLRRPAQTLEHGAFRACETVYVCGHGCTAEPSSTPGASTTAVVTQRSESFAQILLPRRAVGYDVMTFVGLQRYLQHRQRKEIQNDLEARGVHVSTGSISNLAQDFVIYLGALHQRRAPALRAAMAQDGGWPMHIDATGEDGRGMIEASREFVTKRALKIPVLGCHFHFLRDYRQGSAPARAR